MKPGVSQLVPKKAQVMTSSFQARGYFSEYFKGVSNVGPRAWRNSAPSCSVSAIRSRLVS